MAEYTHDDLVSAAETWLRGAGECLLVLTEPGNWWLREQPDAFGLWFPTYVGGKWFEKGEYRSICVECKTSLSDIYSNRSKKHIKSGGGAGMLRYYLCPPDLAKVLDDRLDEDSEWGILRPWSKGAHTIREAKRRELTVEQAKDEIALLYTVLRGRVSKFMEERG